MKKLENKEVKGDKSMDNVTGFYKESGLFITCPNCHTSLKFDVSSLFMAIYKNTNYECDKCKKCLSMSLLITIVDNIADAEEGGWDE